MSQQSDQLLSELRELPLEVVRDRVRARLADWRVRAETSPDWRAWLRIGEETEADHRPEKHTGAPSCRTCGHQWPCPNIAAVLAPDW